MSRYTLYVTPDALKEIKNVPDNIRQRLRRAITAPADKPRPAKSKALDVAGLAWEVRRLRLDRWRVVYAVSDAARLVDVLAVRKRPPYDYGDLANLLGDYPSA